MNIVPDSQRELYKQEGYMILPAVIPPAMLEMLREECSYYLGYYDSIMDAKGVQTEGISHRGKRYFINNRYRLSNRLWQFIFSDLMAKVAEATVGPEAQLFHEQWVVKGAEQGMKFSWHQDSGYVKWYDPTTNHKPYVTCWCTLDAVNEENGTVYILPHSRAGTRGKIIDHHQGRRLERPDRLHRQRSRRSADCSRRQHRGVRQLCISSQRPEQDQPDAPRLSSAIQRRANQTSRRQAVGDGHAVSARREKCL